MPRSTKPRVLTKCVANTYTGPGERIIEFSHNGLGGLISFREMADGRLRVEVYRCDDGIDLVVDTARLHPHIKANLAKEYGQTAEKTSLRSFLAVAEDVDGNNQDFFVTAESAEQAFKLWCEDYALNHEMPEGELAQHFGVGAVVRVFPVPAPTDQPDVHVWGKDESFEIKAFTQG